MSMANWPARIGMLIQRNAVLARLDKYSLHEYPLPRLALTTEKLAELERRLGFNLDPQYRGFLLAANGWPCIQGGWDLFGDEELLGGGRARRAEELLETVSANEWNQLGFPREKALPIVVSADRDDVVFFARSDAGLWPVIWWGGGELVERHDSFESFFDALIAYTDVLEPTIIEQTELLDRELGG